MTPRTPGNEPAEEVGLLVEPGRLPNARGQCDRRTSALSPATAAAADLLVPLLPGDRRTALAAAVERAQRGHTRVLVLGAAKRGKSTLVNALFEAAILPTGAIPLTAVTTAVSVGPERSALVSYRDGRCAEVGIAEIADWVTQRGNPGNARAVDVVRVVAPCRYLPPGTEVVDTPGAGSVNLANTAEAERALAIVDVAVLVVSADPPVAVDELELLTTAMTTAARCAVVVNKVDLLGQEDLVEVVGFSRRALTQWLGFPVPVFPLSALPKRRRDSGFEDFVRWLGSTVERHGLGDVSTSTVRALMREANALRDATIIAEELLGRTGTDARATQAVLERILDRVDVRARAGVDHVEGAARRQRAALDAAHAEAVDRALAMARDRVLACDRDIEDPERLAEEARAVIRAEVGRAAGEWSSTVARDLERGMREAVAHAQNSILDELVQARRATEDLLKIDLSDIGDPPRIGPHGNASFEVDVDEVWKELVSTAIRRRLPAAVRRRRVRRELEEWCRAAVPRPFGRARSALQVTLGETVAAAVRAMGELRDDYLAALDRGLSTIRGVQARAARETRAEAERLARRRAELDRIVDLLHSSARRPSW